MFTLPRRCAICAAWCHTPLCPDCDAAFVAPAQTRCTRCGHPTGLPMHGCGHCRTRSWPLDATVIGADYAFPWDVLIRDLKFHAALQRAETLAVLLARRVGAADVDVVTALPLHASRLRARGYNQSWEIARRVARALGTPAEAGLITRWRDTAAQTELDEKQRARNVKGAFMPTPHAAIRGRRIAVVDDVTTTGATACAAAEALREAGAAHVALWAVARTP